MNLHIPLFELGRIFKFILSQSEKSYEKVSFQFENGPYYILLLFDFLTIYLHQKFFRSSHKPIYLLQLKLGCAQCEFQDCTVGAPEITTLGTTARDK